MKSKRIASVDAYCVACGTCMKECPFGAISIYKGLRAVIDGVKCVGCGKCSKVCPASTITIVQREEDV